jgi:hypothetical protein
MGRSDGTEAFYVGGGLDMAKGPTWLEWFREYWLYSAIGAFYLAIVFLVTLFRDNPIGDIPFLATTAFSTLTLVFAYLAYRFSKEKFRLDLFDKRFAIYEATLTFCSQVLTHGSLRAARPEQRAAVEAAIRAAEASFRGIGYHKARALFGEDIQELFHRLNKSFAWLTAYAGGPGNMAHEQWANKFSEETMFVLNTVHKLPDLFKSYMYFGDYKRDWN